MSAGEMSLDFNTGNSNLDTKLREWIQWDKNPKTKAEICDLFKKNDIKTLEHINLTRLEFGTAGLRGVMGAGFNRMNDLVIIQTTQGMAKYVSTVCPNAKTQGVVVGYDGRHNSERFAHLTANIFLSLEIPVYLFSKMVATPFIPYTILKYKAAAGIMVTASHNPKEDNGYKVYWTNGAQIISPHDKGIQSNILENLEPWENSWNLENLHSNPFLKDPLLEVKQTYNQMLQDFILYRNIITKTPIKFTFTPMHGVAYVYMTDAFDVCGFAPFFPVKEQMHPDPDFPTVKFPNPEEGKSALDLSFKTANENNSTVILANDPDADRLAVAEKQSNGEWKVFTGNEIGSLFGWWLWHCHKESSSSVKPEDVYMIASTVSSKILAAIARKESFNFIETLTGFKWMGNKAVELMEQGKTVLFAFEEAIGFMCGTKVLDKDGMSAAIKIAELAAYLGHNHQRSLNDQLHYIFETYGYHVSRNSYYICHCQATIKSMFERLRNFNGSGTYPEVCGKFIVKNVRDLTTGYDNSQPENKAILPSSKSSQMITFNFTNGCVATLRTSGTEPKIKYYTEFCAQPGQSDWSALDAELELLVQCIVEEFMEPEKNKLIPRSD